MEPKHILFPVDFSDSCTAASAHVRSVAESTGSRLTLLHVLECPPSSYDRIKAAGLSSLVNLPQIREERQEQLNQYLDEEFRSLGPLRLLVQGDPPEEIVTYAQRENVGLIMMPTRGGGVFRRLLLGSVTSKVLHDAACPVWTTSHAEGAAVSRYPYRTIVCGIDLSEDAAETLRWASMFASEQKARLRVVHAIHVEEHSSNRGVVKVREYLREIALEEWEELRKKHGFDEPLYIAYGSVGSALREAALDLEADLVVIGRGRFQEPFGRLRSNSYAVLRESPCPVISV
jgi:nucleotide-binding universal stress UspA family protein